jgi:hypothetical protein
MEPEGSLPCSQKPSTGPYPEPDESRPYHPVFLRSILILSTHLRLGLPSGLFPSGFPTNILYSVLLFPFKFFKYESIFYKYFCNWQKTTSPVLVQSISMTCRSPSMTVTFDRSWKHSTCKNLDVCVSISWRLVGFKSMCRVFPLRFWSLWQDYSYVHPVYTVRWMSSFKSLPFVTEYNLSTTAHSLSRYLAVCAGGARRVRQCKMAALLLVRETSCCCFKRVAYLH